MINALKLLGDKVAVEYITEKKSSGGIDLSATDGLENDRWGIVRFAGDNLSEPLLKVGSTVLVRISDCISQVFEANGMKLRLFNVPDIKAIKT